MIAAVFPAWFTGVVTLLSLIVSITFWFLMMLPGVLLRCVPIHGLQRLASRYCVRLATNWVATNVLLLRLLHRVNWEVDLEGDLDPKKSYLLVANHQSWADILMLFDVFHQRTPFARFFLKRDLMYVPIVGVVCWAMDFPFMTRKAAAADLATTRRACELYREVPVTVVNFLEGTRFSVEKQAATGSPYARLLKPKAGGVAYTLNAMGDQFAGVVDVTVEYAPTRRALAWSWLCGEQADVRLHVAVRPVPEHLLDGDYGSDPAHRAAVQAWLHELWTKKDARLQGGLGRETRAPLPSV